MSFIRSFSWRKRFFLGWNLTSYIYVMLYIYFLFFAYSASMSLTSESFLPWNGIHFLSRILNSDSFYFEFLSYCVFTDEICVIQQAAFLTLFNFASFTRNCQKSKSLANQSSQWVNILKAKKFPTSTLKVPNNAQEKW